MRYYVTIYIYIYFYIYIYICIDVMCENVRYIRQTELYNEYIKKTICIYYYEFVGCITYIYIYIYIIHIYMLRGLLNIDIIDNARLLRRKYTPSIIMFINIFSFCYFLYLSLLNISFYLCVFFSTVNIFKSDFAFAIYIYRIYQSIICIAQICWG